VRSIVLRKRRGATVDVMTKDIEYQADGRTMIGRLAVPSGSEPLPGVLLGHEGCGLTDYRRWEAERLAGLGYVAFAMDYFGGGQVLETDDFMRRLGELVSDTQRTRALGFAGLDILRAEPRVDPTRLAGVGYCFGGQIMLELARAGADLKAVVALHAGLGTADPGDAKNITGKVFVGAGSEDHLVPYETRQAFMEEMRAGGVDWQLIVYGGASHNFTHPELDERTLAGIGYHQPSAERSWRAMLDLFEESLT
jgi:dienelactone hydrolase